MSESSNAAYCAICAQAILRRVKAVRKQVRPVRKGKDPDAIHDMRVASRRLRAALALFEPCGPSRWQRWRVKIRKVTRALGAARDLDVQIATVQAIKRQPSHASWGAGLDCLLTNLRQRRRGAQGKVDKALARMDDSGILDEMDKSLGKLAKRARQPEDGAQQATTRQLAQKMILGLLDDLESYDSDLARPKAIDSHHAMRIAAKHLRYSLEVFEPLYGGRLKPALRCAKQMQTLLGELHDCDVWITTLPEFLAGETATVADDPQKLEPLVKGIEAFRRDRIRRRQTIYRQCLRRWQQCKTQKVWSKLRQILRIAVGAG